MTLAVHAPVRPLPPLSWIGGPAALALAATLALGVPFRAFGLSLPEPAFPMATAFAWAMIRPSLLAPLVLLALGLFLDLYWGTPTGLWALSLLTTYALTLLGRHLMLGQGVYAVGIGYALTVALGFGVAFTVVLLRTRVPPSLSAVGLQWAVTLALFPFVQRLIRRFDDVDARFR